MAQTRTPKQLSRPLVPFLLALTPHRTDPSDFPSSLFGVPVPTTPTPLTPIVAKAVEYITIALEPWALNHCYRTYAYGAAVAHRYGWDDQSVPKEDRYRYDAELFFLGAILHDLGWIAGSECRCGGPEEEGGTSLSFEIWGGIKARQLLLQWGATKAVADEVCEAIIRHTEGYQNGMDRSTRALISLGAMHDLQAILHGPSIISPVLSRTIISMYPRYGLTAQLAQFFGEEVTTKPGCLMGTWTADLAVQGIHLGQPKDFEDVEGTVEEGKATEEWIEKRKGLKWEI